MSSKIKTLAITIPAFAALLLATACQSAYRQHADRVTSDYRDGLYQQAAAAAASGAAARQSDTSERVIYNLEAARTAQVAGDFESSKAHYELAYEDIRPYLDTKAQYTVTEGVATTAVNQAMATYKATPGERIMASSLNSINYLATGDREGARLELNRARDWQDDAIKRYAKEIEAEQRAVEQDAERDDVADAVTDDVPDNMRSYYRNLDRMTGYADYQNPFTSHLRAVYLLTNAADDGDRDNARFDFRQCVQANPDCEPAVREDLLLLESSQRYAVPPTTWVYFMTGRAPHYEELEIVVPVPVQEVPTAKAAFPVLRTNGDELRYLEVKSQGGGDATRTVSLVDMDSVVGSEFKTRLPIIISQEIASAAAKAAATYGMTEGMGDWGTVMGTIYQQASAEADLRSWRTMPKQVQVARVPTPTDGRLVLTGPGGRDLGTVSVVPGESNIVVVTMPSTMAIQPSVVTVQMTGTPVQPAIRSTEANQRF
ncbi:MAG: hypothetical protein MK116_07145 [Phycisphaerales bacterium]|nr:hypothetical protein [Phycisphaerales bacterium]